MSQVDEAVLDLTTTEASLLADVLGVAPPPGLLDPLGDADHAPTPVGSGAAGSLIERRILDEEGTVAAPVADLLTVVGSPHLLTRAVYEIGGEAEIRSYAVRPEMGVEQRRLAGEVARFTPFDPSELVGRVLAFVAPGDCTEDEGSDLSDLGRLTFECSSSVIDEVFTAGTDEGSAAAALEADGVATAPAEAFAKAAANLRSTSSLTVLHRPAKDEIVGVELTWMDSDRHGLWLIEPGPKPSRQTIEPIARPDLIERLAAFLPST